MNDVRSDSIENAVETGAFDQLANAKAKKKKKQKKKEAENNNNRQALKSQRKRIATSILALLLFDCAYFSWSSFRFGTSRNIVG
jgi:hypothetical protein